MPVGMLVALKLAAVLLLGFEGTGPNVAAQGERTIMAQSLSSRCATPAGTCFVPPQPIGTPCFCGQYHGTIIP